MRWLLDEGLLATLVKQTVDVILRSPEADQTQRSISQGRGVPLEQVETNVRSSLEDA